VRPASSASSRPAAEAVQLASVDDGGWEARPTAIAEVDRVLGGGLVPGSVSLLGGEPGIGKSTLLLQLLARSAATGVPCLLVAAEESAQQVRARAERLGPLPPSLWVVAETDLGGIEAAIDRVTPELVVVDSIQAVADARFESAPGSVAQVRECAAAFVRMAKTRAMTTVLVGHVTKEGALAGPRVLEHVVDTVLSFEGDRHHALRMLRAVKHRFGPTGELGVFEMGDAGLSEVADPSRLLLGDRRPGLPGSVVVPAMEGRRPILVEVQALVVDTNAQFPRRSAHGLDGSRLALLIGVLENRTRIPFTKREVFASAVGGVRLNEPAVDLGVALALASAADGWHVPGDVVACGEVGLGGELRQVGHTARRLAEAARLGFTAAVVPTSAPDGPDGMRLLRVDTLRAALDAMRSGLCFVGSE
jgi:DNA repair protein RadA/Sms